jgi:hypothetical protein
MIHGDSDGDFTPFGHTGFHIDLFPARMVSM